MMLQIEKFNQTTANLLEKFNSLKYAPQIKIMLTIFASIFLASIIISIELALFCHLSKFITKEGPEIQEEIQKTTQYATKEKLNAEYNKVYSKKYPIKSTIFLTLMFPVALLLIPMIISSIILLLPLILLNQLIYSRTQHSLFNAEVISQLLPNNENATLEEKIQLLFIRAREQTEYGLIVLALIDNCFDKRNIDFLYNKLSERNDLAENDLQKKINYIFQQIKKEDGNIRIIIDEKDVDNFVKKHIGDKRKIKDLFLKILFYTLMIPFLLPIIIFAFIISPIVITLLLNVRSLIIEVPKETQDQLIESYLFLGFSSFAETSDATHKIDSHHKKLAFVFHPDKNTNENSNELMKKINQAKDFLINPENKKISFTEKQFNIVKKQFDQQYQNQNIYQTLSII